MGRVLHNIYKKPQALLPKKWAFASIAQLILVNECRLAVNSKAATCCIYLIHDTLDLQAKYLFH